MAAPRNVLTRSPAGLLAGPNGLQEDHLIGTPSGGHSLTAQHAFVYHKSRLTFFQVNPPFPLETPQALAGGAPPTLQELH